MRPSRRVTRTLTILMVIVLLMALLTVAAGLVLTAVLNDALQSAVEEAGFTVVGGELSVDPTANEARAKDLHLERDLGHSSLTIRIEDGRLAYDLERLFESEVRLDGLELDGLQIELRKRKPEPVTETTSDDDQDDDEASDDDESDSLPSPDSRLTSIDVVEVKNAKFVIEDEQLHDVAGRRFRLEGSIDEARIEDLQVDDLLTCLLFQTRLKGSVAGGTLTMKPGRVQVRGLELRQFTAFLERKANLELLAGTVRIWLVVTRQDGGLKLEIYLEARGLKVRKLADADEKLARKVGFATLVAFVNRRGPFFAQAFSASVASEETDPALALPGIGMVLAKAFFDALLDDRLDLRRPTGRPLHPHLATLSAIAAHLRTLKPEQWSEVYEGALQGREVQRIELPVEHTGRSLTLRRWVRGRVDGLLVQVERPGRVGQTIGLDGLVISGLKVHENEPLLVLRPIIR